MPLAQGRYIEAPDYYTPQPGDGPLVFLGGGITGCPRWHDGATQTLLSAGRPLVVCNPNRRNFPIHDPAAGWEQVRWEQHHLHLPGVITLMYFPASDPTVTTQPIAMFELGQILGENTGEQRRQVVLAVDPGYPRAVDIALMCRSEAERLGRPALVIHHDLACALDAVLAQVDELAAQAC